MEEKEGQDLIDEALKVYGISPENVFNSRIDKETGEAVIVTNGGKKIRHRRGEAAKYELTGTDIAGERLEEDLVWDAKLNQSRQRD